MSLLGIIVLNYADLPSCLLFYRNYMPLGMDEHGGFYTAHFWTLAMEEHFYLIWPMLLLVVKPRRAGKVAFLLAMLVFCWRVVEGHFQLFAGLLPQANLLTSTDTRTDGLLWGCLAAIYFPKIQRPGCADPLFAVVDGAPGIAAGNAAHASSRLDLVARDSAPGAAGEHGHPAGKLVRAGFGMAADAMDWNPGLQSLYLAGAFSARNRVGDGAGGFRELQRPPWNLLALLVAACLSRYLVEIPMNRMGHRLSASPLSCQIGCVSAPFLKLKPLSTLSATW